MMKTVKQLEILEGIKNALSHFIGNREDYYVVFNTKKRYVIMSNKTSYNDDEHSRQMIKLIDYLKKSTISFFDFKTTDSIELSYDRAIELLALLRIEGY